MIPFQSKQALIDDQIRSIQANVSSCFIIHYFTKNLLFIKKMRWLKINGLELTLKKRVSLPPSGVLSFLIKVRITFRFLVP